MKALPLLALHLLVFAAMPAGAAVVYSSTLNLPVPFSFSGIYLNPATGSTSPNEATDPMVNLFFGGVGIGSNALLRPMVSGIDRVANLMAGTVIDDAGNFVLGANGSSTHVGAGSDQFQIGTPGNLGFAMQTTNGGPTYYGWMQVVINNAGAGTVIDWAYENQTGVAITVGAVPEAGCLTLVVLGAAGAVLRRRR